jgi:rhodanese-related sulfurtransferase
MLASSFSISAHDLWALVGNAHAPQVIDVRRRDAYADADVIPTAVWRDIHDANWTIGLDPARMVAVACKRGHEMSQAAAARLRADGYDARVLTDGYAGWTGARLPLLTRAAVDRFVAQRPSLWVTRRRPKIDRIACPWLVQRFIDPTARILFVDPEHVEKVAAETGAIPFDIADVELSHEGERCSFDTMLRLFGLEHEPHLARLALIVRGADTSRPDLAPEAAGLHAVSLGLSAQAGDDDHGLLRQGFIVYDALFAWARFAAEERHNWPAKAA